MNLLFKTIRTLILGSVLALTAACGGNGVVGMMAADFSNSEIYSGAYPPGSIVGAATLDSNPLFKVESQSQAIITSLQTGAPFTDASFGIGNVDAIQAQLQNCLFTFTSGGTGGVSTTGYTVGDKPGKVCPVSIQVVHTSTVVSSVLTQTTTKYDYVVVANDFKTLVDLQEKHCTGSSQDDRPTDVNSTYHLEINCNGTSKSLGAVTMKITHDDNQTRDPVSRSVVSGLSQFKIQTQYGSTISTWIMDSKTANGQTSTSFQVDGANMGIGAPYMFIFLFWLAWF